MDDTTKISDQAYLPSNIDPSSVHHPNLNDDEINPHPHIKDIEFNEADIIEAINKLTSKF